MACDHKCCWDRNNEHHSHTSDPEECRWCNPPDPDDDDAIRVALGQQ